MASANISSVVNAIPECPSENQLECTDPAAKDAAYTAQPTPMTTLRSAFAWRAMSMTVSHVNSTSKSHALLSTQRRNVICGSNAWLSTSTARTANTMRHSCAKLNARFAPITTASTTPEISTSNARPSRNTSAAAALWLPNDVPTKNAVT